jgi:anti-sigma regulatory factor (Ser/Thr protein kinase)
MLSADEQIETVVGGAAKPQFLTDCARICMPTRIELINDMADLLARRAVETGAVSEQRAGQLTLVLIEALVNAVVHGNLDVPSALKESPDDAFSRTVAQRSNDPDYSGRLVDIHIEYDGERLTWTITDEGRGFDVEARLRRLNETSPEDLALSSGRGIMLMRAFTDGLEWSLGGREVRMTVRRNAPDKRVAARTPIQTPVRVLPLDSDGSIDWQKAFSALAVDASAGGISLLGSRLEAARHMLVEIPIDGRNVYLPATVCHVRQLGDMVQIGCRFSEDAPAPSAQRQEALRRLGRLIQHANADASCRLPHDDGRQHVRAAYTKTIGICSAGQDSPAIKLARNLSLGGMAFLSQQPLDMQQVVKVRFVEEDTTMPAMRAQVVRCLRISQDMHDIGVRFI